MNLIYYVIGFESITHKLDCIFVIGMVRCSILCILVNKVFCVAFIYQ